MQTMSERRFRPWRARLWSPVSGPEVLEVGVGTDKNLPFYPGGLDITAIDLTSGMLDRAHQYAVAHNIPVDFPLLAS